VTDDWLRTGGPEETFRVAPVERDVASLRRARAESLRAANLDTWNRGRERLVEAIRDTRAALRAAGSPGLGTVVRFSLLVRNWRGWVLSEGFYLLANGDMAAQPGDEAFRHRFRHRPEDYARRVLTTTWTEYRHGDDRTGVPHDRLDETSPAEFEKWVADRVRGTARPLAVLLVRHGLRDDDLL